MKTFKIKSTLFIIFAITLSGFSQSLVDNDERQRIIASQKSKASTYHVHNLDELVEQITDIQEKISGMSQSNIVPQNDDYDFDFSMEVYVGRDELVRQAKANGGVAFVSDVPTNSFENLARNIGFVMTDMQKLMAGKGAEINPKTEKELHEMEEQMAVVLATFNNAVQKSETTLHEDNQ